MFRKTKIICTVGPAVNTYEKIVQLVKAGMNVGRINLSHGSRNFHKKMIDYLKKAREEFSVPLAILLDTKGPEVRVGEIEGGRIGLKRGDRWRLTTEEIIGNNQQVSITPSSILKRLSVGNTVLFNDGYISSRIVEIDDKGFVVEIDNDGVMQSRKGVNIPDVRLGLPAITEKDIDDIKFGCANGIDIIALSFVCVAENVITVKNLLKDIDADDVLVIAKIESALGVKNFDSILQTADGIMIARGDLGVEVPLNMVPKLQKEMIRKCYFTGKPSITATQMLESMIYNPRPTRAEVSDVANAIYDSASAVMLSGETAAGEYPISAVEIMKSVIRRAEEDLDYEALFSKHAKFKYSDVPSSIALASVKTANSSNVSAIFTFTRSGTSARLLSRLRPKIPVLAITTVDRVYHQMSLYWGIIPFLGQEAKDYREAFIRASAIAIQRNICSYGDAVVITAGTTFGISGTTNMMVVENIGDVLVRGQKGFGKKVFGNVRLLMPCREGMRPFNVRGNIVVITKYENSVLPFLKEALAVILANQVEDISSEEALLQRAKEFGKPVIVRADAACQVLKEGQLITLDPAKASVYKGVVVSDVET